MSQLTRGLSSSASDLLELSYEQQEEDFKWYC